MDDQEYRVTHTFRGYDIEPFTLLEAEAGKLINYVPNNVLHGEVLDQEGYKYSKFRDSTPAVNYLEYLEPDKILTYLANKAGLIDVTKTLSLDQIVDRAVFDPARIWKHSIISEAEFLC
jgi:hypothetical protein